MLLHGLAEVPLDRTAVHCHHHEEVIADARRVHEKYQRLCRETDVYLFIFIFFVPLCFADPCMFRGGVPTRLSFRVEILVGKSVGQRISMKPLLSFVGPEARECQGGICTHFLLLSLTSFGSLILGSTSVSVLTKCKCEVLVVKPSEVYVNPKD